MEQIQLFQFQENVRAIIAAMRLSDKTRADLRQRKTDCQFFAALIAKDCHFITRPKSNSKVEVLRYLSDTDTVKDMLIHLGTGQNGTPILKSS
ncbi:MAG: hypothetical protein V9H69_25355 [Anaerolineae bacterium]|jgi:hypothetical protein